MHDRRTASRRSVLATAGVTALAAVAGCSGDGDGEGENGTEGDGGAADGTDSEETETSTPETGGEGTETAMPEPSGEQVVSETFTDTSKEWKYELEQGDTITVLATTEREHGVITASIDGPEGVNMRRIDSVGHDRMQLTAEEDSSYTVFIGTNGNLTAEVYVNK